MLLRITGILMVTDPLHSSAFPASWPTFAGECRVFSLTDAFRVLVDELVIPSLPPRP